MCSIQFTKASIHFLLRCFRCLVLGGYIKLYTIGIISMESIKMPKIFMEATIPNSVNSLLSVIIKVAKPHAVVTLVIRVALPILDITLFKDNA